MKFLNKFLLGVWNVGIIESPVQSLLEHTTPPKIRWMRHHYRDRFFADPFLLDCDKDYYYILAEEYPFHTPVGYISLLTIHRRSMHLKHKQILIREPHHLSYPTVYNGMIIPEAYRSGTCCGYCLQGKTITGKQEIIRHGLIDQTFLSLNGTEWIFATDHDDPLKGLKLFYRQQGTLNWTEHPHNPIKTDIHTARPGGNFFRINDTLYRPVQDSELRYGHKIRIMRIDELSPESFHETQVAEISSEHCTTYNMGLHTFNVYDNFIVVDGYREYHSFFIKPLCLKFPKLMKLGEKRI